MAEHPVSFLIVEPWRSAAPGDGRAEDLTRLSPGLRANLLVPSRIDAVADARMDEFLPRVGGFTDEKRFEWRCFELPSPGEAKDSTPLELWLIDGRGERESLRIASSEDAGSLRERKDVEGAIEENERRMVEGHVSLMRRLVECEDGPDVCRDESDRRMIAWRAGAAAELWRAAGGDDAAWEDLPHALARVLTPRLARRRTVGVSRPPDDTWDDAGGVLIKRKTTRRPALRRLSAGLREAGWFRGARDASEEDLWRRSLGFIRARAAQAMMRPGERSSGEGDVTIEGMIRSIDRTLGTPGRSMRSLPGKEVHLDERTGVLIERCAMRLIEDDARRRHAWRWRQRVWAERCQMLLWSAMDRLAPVSVGSRSRLFFRSQPDAGRWMDAKTAPGCWELSGEGREASVLVVDGRRLDEYAAAAPFTHELPGLRPDVVIVRRDRSKPDAPAPLVVCVWCVLDGDPSGERLARRCGQVDARLKVIRSPSDLRGMIFQPVAHGWEVSAAGRCRGVRVEYDLWRQEEQAAALLAEMLR